MNQTFKKHDQVTRAIKEEKLAGVKTVTCLKEKESTDWMAKHEGLLALYKYEYEAVGGSAGISNSVSCKLSYIQISPADMGFMPVL